MLLKEETESEDDFGINSFMLLLSRQDNQIMVECFPNTPANNSLFSSQKADELMCTNR